MGFVLFSSLFLFQLMLTFDLVFVHQVLSWHFHGIIYCDDIEVTLPFGGLSLCASVHIYVH